MPQAAGLIIIQRRVAIHSEAGRPSSRVRVRTASRVQDRLYCDRAQTYCDVSTRPNASHCAVSFHPLWPILLHWISQRHAYHTPTMDSTTEYAHADDLAALSTQQYADNFFGEEQEQARELEELYAEEPENVDTAVPLGPVDWVNLSPSVTMKSCVFSSRIWAIPHSNLVRVRHPDGPIRRALAGEARWVYILEAPTVSRRA